MSHEYFKVGTTQALINAVKARVGEKPDGSAYAPDLTAGAALGITGDGPTTTAAWLERTSTSDGPTTAKCIHGNTVRWNQLVSVPMSEGETQRGITFTPNADGTVALSGTSTQTIYKNLGSKSVAGHTYLVRKGGTLATDANLALYNDGGGITVNSQESAIATANVEKSFFFRVASGATVDGTVLPQIFDLTAMFGAGNEPATVAEFEALYPADYYPYDAGSLLPVNMEGIESTAADESWTQQRTIPAGTLRSAGSVYDELTETAAITRIGERAYQSGDESDATVVTDGTVTHYPLTTPTTVEIDPPLNMTYRTAAGGTERVMVPTGELSAPPTIVTAQGYTAESLRDAALSAIAPVENGTASTNYAVGSYLVHGGQLCKVTTAIATGEAISIGTNVTATTVMAEVLSLTQ